MLSFPKVAYIDTNYSINVSSLHYSCNDPSSALFIRYYEVV